MAGIGLPELALILFVLLLLFGPRRLPELGKALGETIRMFRRSADGEEKKAEDQG